MNTINSSVHIAKNKDNNESDFEYDNLLKLFIKSKCESNSEVSKDLNELQGIVTNDDVDFEKEIALAKEMQRKDGKLKASDYKKYLDDVKSRETFKAADRLITKMLSNSKIDKALGFSTPKLILDNSVTNFYDFKSPRMRTGSALTVENGTLVREGKFVDNPESSFNVVDYFPEIEGKELASRVPVAE